MQHIFKKNTQDTKQEATGTALQNNSTGYI